MKSRLLVIFLFCILIAGCNDLLQRKTVKIVSAETLTGSWRLHSSSKTNTGETNHTDKLLEAAQDNEVTRQGIILSFFPDGTFTEVWGSGTYKTGKWHYTDKAQSLYLVDSIKVDTLYIKQAIVNNKEILHLSNKPAEVELEFIRTAFALKHYHEDPFYYTNNFWRIKPAQQEDASQLQDRLAGYFQHLIYVLKAAKDRKLNAVSFEFSLGIVKIYNGGIGIYPLKIVPETWIDTYYNRHQAIIAYDMFRRYLQTTSYKGVAIGEWIEDDYSILLGIYGDAKQGKFPKLEM